MQGQSHKSSIYWAKISQSFLDKINICTLRLFFFFSINESVETENVPELKVPRGHLVKLCNKTFKYLRVLLFF